jgi:hypothetical protein
MKKNSNTPPTLEDLLSSIEHQGRDARRREQIMAMLERMAAEESAARRHTVRLWTVRVAVAASVMGIIMTVARLMQPQPQPVGSQMAQAPSIVPPVLHSDSVLRSSETATVSPTQAPVTLQPSAASDTLPRMVHTMEGESSEAAAPMLVHPMPAQFLAEAEMAALPDGDIRSLQQPQMPLETLAQSEPATAPEAPQDDTPAVKTKPRGNSFFKLFEPKPSMMEGTMLAFHII